MNVVITLEDIQAYAEIDYIISHMNEKYINKIPKKLREFFSLYKDPTYEVKINQYIPLDKQGLKEYTLEIIALLHLRYWCEDETRKQELYNMMIKNQEKLEEDLRAKYNVNNLFELEQFEEDENDDNLPIDQIEDKKGFWTKLKEKFLGLFKK